MSFFSNPENNGLKVLLLVVLVGVAGFFVYNTEEHNALRNTASVGTLVLRGSTSGTGVGIGTGTTGTGTRAVGTLGPCTGITAASLPGATLAPTTDAAFTATTVRPGDVNTVIGQFTINNDTPCKYSLGALGFSFIPSVATTNMVSNIAVYTTTGPLGTPPTTGTVMYGSVLPAPARDALRSMRYVPGTPLMIPPSSWVTLTVKSDVLSTAPVGENFKVQMYALRATNLTTSTVFNMVYPSTMASLISNLMNII